MKTFVEENATQSFWTFFSPYACKLQEKAIFSGFKWSTKKCTWHSMHAGVQYETTSDMVNILNPNFFD